MNRIVLPAQEWLGYDPERGDLHGYTFEQMREFAESIVNECVSVCLKNQFTGTLLYNEGALSSAELIKSRFGVEE